MTIVTVGTYNARNGFWNPATRFHDHDKLIATIDQAPAPDILTLPECTHYRMFNESPLWEVTNRLSELLPGGATYRPFLSTRPGSRNPPGLFVSTGLVEPIGWYTPGEYTSAAYENHLECRIAGHRALVGSVHWGGAGGPAWFDIQSAQNGQLATQPVLEAGDRNCASKNEELPSAEQWYASNARTPYKLRQKARRAHDQAPWTPSSVPYDDLLEAGFWDAAQRAGDTTPTVNKGVDNGSGMLIDRITCSHKLPARLADDSYRVFIPDEDETYSDHRYVLAKLDFDARYAHCYDPAYADH